MQTRDTVQKILKDAIMFYVYAELNKVLIPQKQNYSSEILKKKEISEDLGFKPSWFSEASSNYKDITTTSLIKLLENISHHGFKLPNEINVVNVDVLRIAKILREYLTDNEGHSLISLLDYLDKNERTTLELPIHIQLEKCSVWLKKHPDDINRQLITSENELRKKVLSRLISIKKEKGERS
ncbi:hypothetical protein ABWW58_10270 [Sporolactobacillus sp. STCC-11]|uniref:hypothetical protein n=1 Tax=Sporolactobacillus caesalpiniae TaxID=3230362 RepID=UPI0033945F56